jgi:hypothetical protein
MSVKSFTGKWLGQYTYGEGYSDRLKGKSVPFTLIMEVVGNGILKGHCVDDGYMDEIDARAMIEGSIDGIFINFVKQYRHHWSTQADGGVQENKKRESHVVRYTGEYRNNIFAGEWEITTPRVRKDGSIVESRSGGYWIIHKEL